ncbi:hypothetical protein [Deinococcus sp. QL22]|nr:hypothetical protein [Deinococcus sp. QL22]UQN05415.1 hypothetical protein M1R55_11070 [Deinococcus sp. QL22]
MTAKIIGQFEAQSRVWPVMRQPPILAVGGVEQVSEFDRRQITRMYGIG